MTRLFSLILAIMLFCGCFLFVSCGKEAKIPDDYQIYTDDMISFAYPDSWTKTDGDTVILIGETKIGNNITVVYEEENHFYETVTLKIFEEQMQPDLEKIGISISDVNIAQTKNDSDLKITKISYTASFSGQTMKQTLLITTVKDRTYTVTVTEAVSDTELLNNVFTTLTTK